MRILKLHPEILIGNPKKHMELHFFEDENKLLHGIDYYKDMLGMRTPSTKIVGEWTPSYFDHPLVPYRVLATLGPSVKLLLTIKDPVEALMSLYFLRKQDKRLSLADYFRTLLHDQEIYDECVKIVINSSFVSVSKPETLNEVHLHYSPSDVHSMMLLDETVMASCWDEKVSLRNHPERLQHYFYKENLDRWQIVFPNQILCIQSDELSTRSFSVTNTILGFLGVDVITGQSANLISQDYDISKDQNQEKKKHAFKKHSMYEHMLTFFKKRNRGLEKYCPIETRSSF